MPVISILREHCCSASDFSIRQPGWLLIDQTRLHADYFLPQSFTSRRRFFLCCSTRAERVFKQLTGELARASGSFAIGAAVRILASVPTGRQMISPSQSVRRRLP